LNLKIIRVFCFVCGRLMMVYGHFAIPEILSGPNAAVVLLGDGCDWYIHSKSF